jgi:hypothetical protein
MTSPETNISLKELIRNNCKCVFSDCESCKIEKGVTLAFKEFLIKNRQDWKGNNLIAESEYETIDWAIDELLEALEI